MVKELEERMLKEHTTKRTEGNYTVTVKCDCGAEATWLVVSYADSQPVYVRLELAYKELLLLPSGPIPEPKMKSKFAVKHHGGHMVGFYASERVAKLAEKFGHVYRTFPHKGSNEYDLFIDKRYDPDEVIEYLERQANND